MDAVYQMLCWCVRGGEVAPAKEGLARNLADHALGLGLACLCPINPSKTVVNLTFGWKKGQAPHNNGRYADRKAKFSIDVDPTWHSCPKPLSSHNTRMTVSIYVGKTIEEATSAWRSTVDLSIPFPSPHADQEFEGRLLCDDKPSFVAYQLDGFAEFKALNRKRTVVPIHCE